MPDPTAVHPMRAALNDGRALQVGSVAVAVLILPALGLHASDSLTLAMAGLFLTTTNPWRHQ